MELVTDVPPAGGPGPQTVTNRSTIASGVPMYDVLLPISSVIAQIDVTPSNDELPGAAFWQQVLGWLAWGGLAGSLASLLIGGAVWGLSHANGHSMGASKGKAFALGGMAGAILVGLAATIVNTLSGIA